MLRQLYPWVGYGLLIAGIVTLLGVLFSRSAKRTTTLLRTIWGLIAVGCLLAAPKYLLVAPTSPGLVALTDMGLVLAIAGAVLWGWYGLQQRRGRFR